MPKPAPKKPIAKSAKAQTKKASGKPAPKGAAKPAKPAKTEVKKSAAIRKPEPKKVASKKPDPKATKVVSKPAAKGDLKAKPAGKVDPKSSKSTTKPEVAQLAKTDGAKSDVKQTNKNTSVVNPKMVKKKPSVMPVMPVGLGRLLDGKGGSRKPLIPSGPKATHQRPLGQHGGYAPDVPVIERVKSTLGKKEIEHYRGLLLKKRAEILADVVNMETEALQGGSGSLSNVQSHLAEEGTEAFDQALSLDLAAAERRIVKEINDALKRIEAGTYGMCELTGKPISAERLEELPWARHTIQAAMELERQAMRPA